MFHFRGFLPFTERDEFRPKMIETEHLVKDFGPIRAVDDVTFQVEKGDILGFLGPNGAGKSTTMKMITGFLPPTSGTARVGGHDIRREPIAAKRLFGYLPENGPLYHEMTVTEFLDFIAEMRGYRSKAEKSRRIGRVMEICHLETVAFQPIDTLSKGYRQRVGMAQAVMHDPPYLIMDEPTDGLDPNQKQEVRRLIASMAEEKAIVLSTHILEEVEEMCNRIVIIANGSIVVNETLAELRRRHHRYNAVEIKLAAEPAEADVHNILRQIDGVSDVTVEDGSFTLFPEDGADITARIFSIAQDNNWRMEKLEKVSVKLEDVFRNLTLNQVET